MISTAFVSLDSYIEHLDHRHFAIGSNYANKSGFKLMNRHRSVEVQGKLRAY